MTTIHAVIVHYRTLERTKACLDALADNRAGLAAELDVSLVDNGSADGSSEALQAFLQERGYDWVQRVELTDNRGLGAGLNAGVRPTLESGRPPDYVLVLHPDTTLRSGALATMLGFLQEKLTVGVVGPRFLGEDGEIFPSAFRFPTVTSELVEGLAFGPVTRWLEPYVVAPEMRDEPHETQWLSGAALLMRREVLESIGPFDEAFFLDFGDVDFGMRAYRRGWTAWYLPQAEAVHRPVGTGGGQRRPEHWFAARKRYFEKHHGEASGVLADVVFASSFATNKVRRRLLGKDDAPSHLIRDMLRFGARHLLDR